MSQSVTPFSIETLPVVVHQDVRVVTTELLARAYGTAESNIQDNYRKNIDRFEPGKHFFKLEGEALRDFKNRPESFRSVGDNQPNSIGSVGARASSLILWTERGAARHAKMLSTDEAWNVFERMEDCYFKTERKEHPVYDGPAVVINPPKVHKSATLGPKLQIARAAKSMLRMSATSVSRMLADIADSEGIAPSFLPGYVDEPLVRALTALLKEHGSPLSSKVGSTINPALAAMGILERLERTGSKGDTKWFWSLTDEGLAWGRNETSPNNPRETQPLYYVDKFPKLLNLIESHLARSDQPAT
jgi:hypothetical protein